jgi:DNA repair photolyase
MLNNLSFFDENGYYYYFQYTLNDYQAEGFEPNLPTIEDRIDTFIALSDKIGKDKVIWRFDPIIVCESLPPDDLLKRIKNIGDSLKGYTERMVFSFIDINCYKKVKANLGKMQSEVVELDKATIDYIAKGIAGLNKKWGFQLGTCAESVDLDKYGIEHNRCIDDRLIVNLFRNDQELMKFIGIDEDQLEADFLPVNYSYEKLIDKGQRKACGCIKSKDIGQYDTCPHGCIYCYANTNNETAAENFRKTSLESETLL